MPQQQQAYLEAMQAQQAFQAARSAERELAASGPGAEEARQPPRGRMGRGVLLGVCFSAMHYQ